jgi:NADH dehydrogenase [ubiquinone] 1 alpha subcomplex assembly factor 7
MADESGQAFRRHEIVHVFDDPGSADLTANVDFAYMKEALAGVGKPFPIPKPNIILTFLPLKATPHGPINQRSFLTSLGLAPRLDRLLQSAPTRERKVEIANAARRLVDERGMGGEYQFLGVTPRRVVEEVVKEGEEVYPFEA